MMDLTLASRYYVDGSKLAQVFLHILLNAVDAVKENGKIVRQVDEAMDGVSVSISDNGPGVPIDAREKIFQPFFSKKEEGTGLGLSISHKIIASYNGRIQVSESSLGGACFTVFLPHPVSKAGEYKGFITTMSEDSNV